ncbi:hypothetical protein NC653_036133 [Populus alba x Populus x berolinensis]|uniref:Uncharacterized protein n=3 Tax=Populus TaxID=3689 RepID=A0A4U5NMG4_POPAL|nr:hypothetical protein NC653_036133 [Populus alba x Populus x berolinensis]TKR84116.1 hypothetical protein D5086_0000261490 [Populus alba]
MAAQVIVSKTFLLVLVIAAFAVASAQDSESMAPAPAPGMDAGAGFSSPVSGAIVGFSLVVSLFGMAAQVTISKAFFLLLAIAAFAVVSAQESEMAPAPAPGMDAGAGFSLPVSGAVLGFSLALSLLGFLKR